MVTTVSPRARICTGPRRQCRYHRYGNAAGACLLRPGASLPIRPGELVVTPLGVEGMPLLRFRTGDICIAYEARCKCGREGKRLSPLLGRKDQRLKYRGTTLYPNALYDVLEKIPGVENYQ